MRVFGTKQQRRLYFFGVGVGAVAGVLYGATIGPLFFSPPWLGSILAAISSAINYTITIAIVWGVEVYFFRTRLGRAIDGAPFWTIAVVKFLAYGALVYGNRKAALGEWFVENLVVKQFLVGSGLYDGIGAHDLDYSVPLQIDLGYGLLLLWLTVLLIQLIRVVGDRTSIGVTLGRYRRPRAEERFFLFIDLLGSTTLAERVGPLAVHRFLDRVFQIASDPIDEHEGEIYQYVGDEIVITWTIDEGGPEARPLRCYFAIEKALAAAAADFQRDFGVEPKIRGALHAGPVISGEVGGSRHAIVFHGDVMNTTSRIENATRDLQRPLLVSEDALTRLERKEAYKLEDLGPQVLRGRAATLRLYAVGSGSDSRLQ